VPRCGDPAGDHACRQGGPGGGALSAGSGTSNFGRGHVILRSSLAVGPRSSASPATTRQSSRHSSDPGPQRPAPVPGPVRGQRPPISSPPEYTTGRRSARQPRRPTADQADLRAPHGSTGESKAGDRTAVLMRSWLPITPGGSEYISSIGVRPRVGSSVTFGDGREADSWVITVRPRSFWAGCCSRVAGRRTCALVESESGPLQVAAGPVAGPRAVMTCRAARPGRKGSGGCFTQARSG
jgi:hypothetical protein